jgi:hypothetical protein
VRRERERVWTDRDGSIEHMFAFARGGNQASRSRYMVGARSAVAKGEVSVARAYSVLQCISLNVFSFLGRQQDTGGVCGTPPGCQLDGGVGVSLTPGEGQRERSSAALRKPAGDAGEARRDHDRLLDPARHAYELTPHGLALSTAPLPCRIGASDHAAGSGHLVCTLSTGTTSR